MKLLIDLHEDSGNLLLFEGRVEDYPSLPRTGDRVVLKDREIVIAGMKYTFEPPNTLHLVLFS